MDPEVSEGELLAVIERLPDAVVIADDERRYVYANSAACDLFGLPLHELLGHKIEDFAEPQYKPEVAPQWRRFSDDGVQTGVFRLVRPDGERRNVEFSALASFRPGRHISFLRDVTEATLTRRALGDSESALRLSEMRFRSFVEQSPLSTQTFSVDGNTLSVNRAWRELWGAEMSDLADYNILHDPQLAALGVSHLIERAFQGEPAELPAIAYRPPRGRYQASQIWVRSVIYPVKDDLGHIREVVLVHQDVSEAMRREEAQAAQTKELARSNAELQRFAYVASHDLKEPLRTVSIFSDLLARRYSSALGAVGDEYIQHISQGAHRMSELIDALLNYSRVTIQRDVLLLEVDVNQILDQALDNLTVSISQTAAVIERGSLPRIRCAPLDLVQVFQNLIGNAMKYSADGKPHIIVSAAEGDQDWSFSIQDNGIGIAPRYHEQIFGVFKRLHGREFPGTGIGLAICKAIVERHGGRIGVESQLGQGARFWFSMPKEPEAPA